MNNQEYVIALYNTLRTMKGNDFDEADYYWEIGYKVFKDLFAFFTHQERLYKQLMLMGIKVQINHENDNVIKLYEDITNKIAIPYAEFKEVKDDSQRLG